MFKRVCKWLQRRQRRDERLLSLRPLATPSAQAVTLSTHGCTAWDVDIGVAVCMDVDVDEDGGAGVGMDVDAVGMDVDVDMR